MENKMISPLSMVRVQSIKKKTTHPKRNRFEILCYIAITIMCYLISLKPSAFSNWAQSHSWLHLLAIGAHQQQHLGARWYQKMENARLMGEASELVGYTGNRSQESGYNVHPHQIKGLGITKLSSYKNHIAWRHHQQDQSRRRGITVARGVEITIGVQSMGRVQ